MGMQIIGARAQVRDIVDGVADGGPGIEPRIDRFRTIVFPNRLRELRRARGYPKLLRLAALVPDIPYIRLSKIERGEVVARPEELARIAAALDVPATDLLLDIDAPDFDIAQWAEPFDDGKGADPEEERFAVLLAAALRARRSVNPALSIAALDRDFGLAPVNLSRVENALKPFGRWNASTQGALLRIFGVADGDALAAHVHEQHAAGALDAFIGGIANAEVRHQRSRSRIAELRATLAGQGTFPAAPAQVPAPPVEAAGLELLATSLPGGLIAAQPSGERVPAPAGAGPRAFALKLGRAVLGAGLPARTILVADPDRLPSDGSIAVVREGEAWRLLAVASERDGRLTGYSLHPAHEVDLDSIDPARVATIAAAVFP